MYNLLQWITCTWKLLVDMEIGVHLTIKRECNHTTCSRLEPIVVAKVVVECRRQSCCRTWVRRMSWKLSGKWFPQGGGNKRRKALIAFPRKWHRRHPSRDWGETRKLIISWKLILSSFLVNEYLSDHRPITWPNVSAARSLASWQVGGESWPRICNYRTKMCGA